MVTKSSTSTSFLKMRLTLVRCCKKVKVHADQNQIMKSRNLSLSLITLTLGHYSISHCTWFTIFNFHPFISWSEEMDFMLFLLGWKKSLSEVFSLPYSKIYLSSFSLVEEGRSLSLVEQGRSFHLFVFGWRSCSPCKFQISQQKHVRGNFEKFCFDILHKLKTVILFFLTTPFIHLASDQI